MNLVTTNKNDMTTGSATEEQTYTIGELSREFGLTLRAIRFYEEQGLISAGRTGHFRVFDRQARSRLALICRGKRLGFSLKVIKNFLDLYEREDKQDEQMTFLQRKLSERISILHQQRSDIDQTLAELSDIQNEIAAKEESRRCA